jgi:type I restriction enzyme S subunit
MKVSVIHDAQDHVSEAALAGSLSLIPIGSLLVVVRGMILAHSFPVAETSAPVTINQDMKALTPVEPRLLSYLKLVCHGMRPEILRLVDRSTHGTCKLESSKLFGLPIPIPPLAEQSRIVARVDELMRLCDALEAKGRLEAAQHTRLLDTLLGTLTDSATPEELAVNWQRVAEHFDLLLDRPEAVDALERTVLQLAVRGLLVPQDPNDEPASVLLQHVRVEKERLFAVKNKRDKPGSPIADRDGSVELPQGWLSTFVGDVVEMLNGYAFKSEWFKPAGMRLLRNVNIAHGHVDWSTSAFIDSARAKEYEHFALDEGDLVLTLDRPIISTGLKFAVIRERDLPCLLLQRVARLTPVPRVLSREFLVLWMQSDAFLGALDPGRSNGVPHISTKQVASMPFQLPPIAEQSRIVARVTELRRHCADLRQRLAASQSTRAFLATALVEQVLA